MKRPTITITVTVRDADTGDTVHRETRAAFNAGIRASEAAVRTIARAEGQLYSGDRPLRVGHLYSRHWTGDKSHRTLIVNVEPEVTADAYRPTAVYMPNMPAAIDHRVFIGSAGA